MTLGLVMSFQVQIQKHDPQRKKKIDLDFIKIEKKRSLLCKRQNKSVKRMKRLIKRMKRQTTDWEKCAKHIVDTGLVSIIYKQYLNLNK